MIRNPERESLPTTLSLPEFGRAMAALDLSSVPPENRQRAVLDHLARVMIGSLHDRSLAVDIAASRLLRPR